MQWSFVDDHQLVFSIPFRRTAGFWFSCAFSSWSFLLNVRFDCYVFICRSSAWNDVQCCFSEQPFYWFAFFIMKTPSCCWLLQHPSVSPWLTVNCFSEQFLITVFYSYEYNYIFPNKCIIQIHPLWRLSVIIPVVLPWTFLYLLPAKR